MIYRPLGHSGIDISAIGFGAWAIGGWMWGGADEHQAVAAVGAALDRGVTLIDTAPAYGFGRSEELVGRAIRGRRDRVVLATKCGLVWDREEGVFFFHTDRDGVTRQPSERKMYRCLRPDSIRRELEQSLARLGTDRVDLYQTHWPDASTPLGDTMAELERLKAEGKIRAIGFCNATAADLQAAAVDSDQEKYSLLDRGPETNGLLDHCRTAGMGFFCYSPLANGLLTGKISPDRQYGPGDLRKANIRFTRSSVERVNATLDTLRPLAERHGASLAQLVIAWTIAQPGVTCALCGARDPQQASENAAAADIALSAEELAEIRGAFAK